MSQGRIAILLTIGLAWAGATAAGLGRLWGYGNTPGTASASAPREWSDSIDLPRAADRANLVLLIHPRCPGSRATLGELARLMADCDGKLAATVLVLKPKNMPDGWERTDLWRTAASIPNVTVRSDDGGELAKRFDGATSGQALLYAPDGRLLFAGGITGSRGHAGDNAGRAAITALVHGAAAADAGAGEARAPVYGCPLFDPTDDCGAEGATTCPSR